MIRQTSTLRDVSLFSGGGGGGRATIPSGPFVAYKRSCHPLTTHSHSETTSVQVTSFTAVRDVGNPRCRDLKLLLRSVVLVQDKNMH